MKFKFALLAILHLCLAYSDQLLRPESCEPFGRGEEPGDIHKNDLRKFVRQLQAIRHEQQHLNQTDLSIEYSKLKDQCIEFVTNKNEYYSKLRQNDVGMAEQVSFLTAQDQIDSKAREMEEMELAPPMLASGASCPTPEKSNANIGGAIEVTSSKDCSALTTGTLNGGIQSPLLQYLTTSPFSLLESGNRIDHYIYLNSDKSFCDRCYPKAINVLSKHDENLFTKHTTSNLKRQSTVDYSELARLDNYDYNQGNPRWVANRAIADHLTSSLIKDELLKVSIVMEQFNHAAAVAKPGTFDGKLKELSCLNPDKLKQMIQKRCRNEDNKDSPNYRRSEDVLLRMKQAFLMLGMTNEQVGKSQDGNHYYLSSGLNFIWDKVGKVTNVSEDISCSSVNRADVIRNESLRYAATRIPEATFSLLTGMLETSGDRILEELKETDIPMSIITTIIMSRLLQDGDNSLKDLLIHGKGFNPSQWQELNLSLGTTLPLNRDPQEFDSEQMRTFQLSLEAWLAQVSNHSPNLFMFLNDANVRKKLGSSQEKFVENILSPAIDPEIFAEFSKRCDQSFNRITELACSERDTLKNFSKKDIIKAAQEVAFEVEDKDPKVQSLIQLALGQVVCNAKNNPALPDENAYPDLDDLYSASWGQSDFMRTRKTPHFLERDNHPLVKTVSEEYRKNAIEGNRQNRLLNAAKNASYCSETEIKIANNDYYCTIYSSEEHCESHVEILSQSTTAAALASTKAACSSYTPPEKREQREQLISTIIGGGSSSKGSSPAHSGNKSLPLLNSQTQPQVPDVVAPVVANSEAEPKSATISSTIAKTDVSENLSADTGSSFASAGLNTSLNPNNSTAFNPYNLSTSLSSSNSKPEDKGEVIREIASLSDDGADLALEDMTADQLKVIRDRLRTKANKDKSEMKRAKLAFEEDLEELEQERLLLRDEIQMLKELKKQYSELSHSANEEHTLPAVKTNTNSKTELKAHNIAPTPATRLNLPETPVTTTEGSVTKTTDSNANNNIETSSFSSARVSAGAAGNKRFFSPKSNSRDSQFNQDLGVYLEYFEANPKAILESDSIEFFEKNGQKFLQVQGPEGQKFTIGYDEIKDQDLMAKIVKLEKVKLLEEKSKGTKRSIASILQEEVDKIQQQEQLLVRRQALYQGLLKQFD